MAPRGAAHGRKEPTVDRHSLPPPTATSSPEQMETRSCRSCRATGWVLADVAYDYETGELIEEAVRCFICKGSGSVYVYPKRTERRA